VSCISQLPSDELTKYNLPLFVGDDNIDDLFSSDESEDYKKGNGEDNDEDSTGKIGDHEKEEKDKKVVTVERRTKRRNNGGKVEKHGWCVKIFVR
jgi:hypothetical protein